METQFKNIDDFFDIIKGRRSVRSFKDDSVPKEDIEKLLDAGRWAPTPSNVQSWRFIVVQGDDQLELLKNFSPGFPVSAKASIAICSDQRDLKDFGEKELEVFRAEEAAMATQNMMLTAYAMGLGTCCVASFSKRGVAELLGLPESIKPVLLLALGHPEYQPKAPERKDLTKITFWGEYKESK